MTDLVLAHVRMPGDATVCNVHIRAGRIHRIAGGDQRPGGERIIDGGGRWLVPGLWDEHVHMTQ